MAELNFDLATEKMGGLAPTDAPIPGESLTASPEDKAPFERPAKFVDQEEAVRELFMKLTDPDKVDDIMDTMRMGTPVEDLAQVILFEGFRTGMYSPDLMLTMIEPTIYLLLAIADAGGIDPEIYPEEDFWGDDEEAMVMEREAGAFSGLMRSKGNLSMKEETKEDEKVSLDTLQRPESVTPSMIEKIQSMTKSKEG